MDDIKNEELTTSAPPVITFFKSALFQYLIPIPFLLWIIGINLFSSSISILPLKNHVSVVRQSDGIVPSDTVLTDNMTHIDSFQTTDSSIAITFILGNSIDYPYAGILFKTYKDSVDSTLLNLSQMDYIELDLAAIGGKREVNIYFSEFIDGYTSLKKEMSWRTFEYQLAAEESMKRYRIDLKEFKTNPWWFQKQAVPQQSIPKGSLKKVLNLVIENGNYETKGQPLSLKVQNIRFGRELKGVNTLFCILFVLFYVVVFLFRKFGLRKVMGPVVIPYRQLEITSYIDDDTKKIEAYVAVNYTDPELTVTKLCEDTGISHSKVQAILKKQFQLTFRQYLNKIKVHEAKRLLQETDRQVTDIAYRVGYKNVTHFNRIFKEMEGISPIQFRKST